MIEALDIHVQGIVQGVGFRPFVYRMAKKYLINGWVLNATDGVHIHAEGEGKLLDEFVLELSDNAPAAAQVEQIELAEVPLEGFDTFEIRFSDAAEVEQTTLVSPDLATCDDCLSELFNPNDRRFRYPFINCTNCGPRFTIIEGLPYDRAKTSMRAFEMCPRCAAEYADPLDRRFHAQPDACFECGPVVSFALAGQTKPRFIYGRTREESDAIFARAVEVLRAGGIVAVKGLGGFHLVCDANNAEAVAKLRARKRREGKAFAVMMANADDVRAVCAVNEVEEAVLSGAQRPIVLLRKRAGVELAPQLADGLSELGVMLPYTPVQHLLMHDFCAAVAAGDAGSADSADGQRRRKGDTVPPMLVMTSGNLHDEPIVTSDAEAYEKLGDVADAFLGNNREILTRFDDSVVRVVSAGTAGYAVQFIRRARGYAPVPLVVPFVADATNGQLDAATPPCTEPCGSKSSSPTEVGFVGLSPQSSAPGDASLTLRTTSDVPFDSVSPVIFATGPEQKNTFTLAREGEAFVSQHIGDMENAETYDAWLAAKARFEALFELTPTAVACDKHPEYLTSKWAHDQALPVTEVQHHHAHIASAMAENGLRGPVCGIAFDGTGFGEDGAIWGGEVLLANLQTFERFANFAYVPMPGGAAAVKNPLRMAYGVLWAFDLLEHPGVQAALDALGAQAGICDAMIEQGLNTPMTSSVGRLFDAASALLGVCTKPSYEGEGACLLEALCSVVADAPESDDASARERYAVAVVKNAASETSTAQDTSVLLFDAAPTFRALLDDLAADVPKPVIARRFHDAIVGAVVQTAELVRALYDINTVVLSGGVFMNRYVIEHALAALEAAGFTAAINRDLPPNDGCISYGQAVVAWAAR
ncbi:MAG: carbamoyltransferase HypF [Eggerthellaceae bacterium]|nr:carbamoyltransferase HypF [Eggerthellaceae bacterium]